MKRWVVALLDLLSVLVFVVIGRMSHGEVVGLNGVVHTAWPFLVGWGIGWLAVVLVPGAIRSPESLGVGLLVWLPTVAVGMVVRVWTKVGVESSFVLVAFVVLGVFLLGWRLLAVLVRRRIRDATQPMA